MTHKGKVRQLQRKFKIASATNLPRESSAIGNHKSKGKLLRFMAQSRAPQGEPLGTNPKKPFLLASDKR